DRRRHPRRHPQPHAGCVGTGAAADPRLRLVHRGRHRRGRPAHRAPVGGPRRRPGRRAGHRRLGGAVRDHRRPDLPRDLQPPRLLRRGRRPGAGVRHLGGRPRHLGRHRAGRRRCLDRLPPARDPAAGLRRRAGARAAGGAGHRPPGQLVQQRVVRRPDRPALGADHPRVERWPGGDRRRRRTRGPRHVPPRVPLRAAVEPGGRGLRDLGRPALPAGPRPGLRALRRLLLRGPALDRAAAHGPGRDLRRRPDQRVHLDRRRAAGPRLLLLAARSPARGDHPGRRGTDACDGRPRAGAGDRSRSRPRTGAPSRRTEL
ncbi:MAG: Prolipoprotein diacylglyceryl transferase, partial [uncultured Blastococcus sp.]